MDRRSWLWRRKSSDKSSGETESLGSGSGSMSSPSERFSDEQQVYSIKNLQSPEITSKHAEDSNSVKILSEKLSAAVATITEKEELVKQHAKVAEEAVTGWERAENEMNDLKQQLDDATNKNSTLEDKIVHLDGALKECLRQLRQVREEQDLRIQEAVNKKSENTESINPELESLLADISAQLEIANVKAETAVSLETDLRLKLAFFEKENASLQLKLSSQLETLEVMTLERDLSTKRAETASKQHLESIKRVAKLEAECRRLKAMARKGASFNDQKSPNDFKVDKISPESHMTSPSNIGFMDDFLEMEKLASIPVGENRRLSLGSTTSIDRCNESSDDNALLKAELEAMINRTAELEERIEMVEAEKVELGLTLTQCQEQLHLSESSFRHLESQFNQCQNQLKLLQAQLKDANKKMVIMQNELDLASELRQAIDLELDDANVRREEAETQCEAIENERKGLLSKVTFLEDRAEKASVEYGALEGELFRMKNEAESRQNQLATMKRSKEAVERELRSTNGKKVALESELQALQAKIKTLLDKIGSWENEVEKERRLSAELKANCRKLESELSRTKHEADRWQSQLTLVSDLKEAVTQELNLAKAKKEEAETQLDAVQSEAKSLLGRVSSLEHEMEKERSLSMEFAGKCKKLEVEFSKIKSEVDIQSAPLLKHKLNKQQEKEIAVAASKLLECKNTIASLGNQLKYLATLDDLFSNSNIHRSTFLDSFAI